MAGVGAGSAITSGFTPNEPSTSAAISTKRSPIYLGSRPTITRAPFGFLPATYCAIPATALRTLATVNSAARIARQPDVPNLIVVLIAELQLVAFHSKRVSYMNLPIQVSRAKADAAELIH